MFAAAGEQGNRPQRQDRHARRFGQRGHRVGCTTCSAKYGGCGPMCWRFASLQAAGIDGRAALAKCDARVLLLAGTKDRLVGPRSVRRIQRVRKDVRVKLIDGPHLLAQTRAPEVWRELEEFMKSVRDLSTIP